SLNSEPYQGDAEVRSRPSRLILKQCLQARVIWLARDTGIGDYRRHVAMRRHVERGVCHPYALGRDRLAVEVRHFLIRARLYRNLIAGVEREIDGRKR